MKWILLIPLLLLGCSIQKYNQPPQWASAVVHHSRFTGLDFSYQGYGLRFGWGSDVWNVIPVSTNKVYTSTISDTFRLGQTASPFNTTITEDVVSGWEGQPPPARHLKIFDPTKPVP